MKIRGLKFGMVILGVLCIFASCNNGSETNTDEEATVIDELSEEEAEESKTVTQIFYNVPSPIEMASLMQRAGGIYQPDILNSVDNAEQYETNADKALNLGIYGADLSYTRIFDQIQESMNYLSAIKKLSDGLGIPRGEGSETINKLEENVDNRDSLLYVISDTYSNADQYLKENDRGTTAAKIIFGGWIEALYIATKIIDVDNPNKEIMTRIGEQKYSLYNLMELLSDFEDTEGMKEYYNDLKKLRIGFDKVSIITGENTITTDTTKKMTVIGGDSEVKIDIDIVKEIEVIVTEIRENLVN